MIHLQNIPNRSYEPAIPHTSTLSRSFTFSKGLAIAALAYLPIQVIRITAFALSIFCCCGIDFSKKIKNFADKLHAIIIIHSLHDACIIIKSSTLCSVRNIAKRNVIWHEKDVKKSKEFINVLKDPKYLKQKGFKELDADDSTKLQNYQIIGAKTTGICFGASLIVIKALLSHDIKNEKELVELIKKYKDGFPEEAAALQNVHTTLIGFDQKLTLEEKEVIAQQIEKAKQEYWAEIEQKKTALMSKKDSMPRQEFARLVMELPNEIKNEQEKVIPQKIEVLRKKTVQFVIYKHKTDHMQRVASLIDLKLKQRLNKFEKADFHGIIEDKLIQTKFNQLKNGNYELGFRVNDKKGHSIVYIKRDFGSYLLDPSIGLIKCSLEDPSKRLCELFREYYPGKTLENKKRDQCLEIIRYYQ